jgi:hypothetical protein
MTIRARSSILVTVLCLAGLAFGILATRGVYDRAYADGAAQVATAPPAAAPPPSLDDAVTAYRAGQWTALALAAFGVLFVGLRAVARRRGSVWLGAFAEYLAGAGAILVAGVAYAIKVGGIDPAVMGTAITAIGAIVFHGTAPPQAGIATSPTASSPPRPPEAGCARLHLMITLGLIATAALLASVACTSPTVRSARHAAAQTIVDCGRAEVQGLATDLIPAVTAIVTGDTPSWREQLDALLSAGTHAGACAIRAVAADLTRKAEQLVTGAHAEGQERVGAEHAREYLDDNHYVFATH